MTDPSPKDRDLYERIKKRLYLKIPTHSAYRSGLLVKEYKEEYEKKYKSKEAYTGTKNKNQGLMRWFDEKWRNQRGEVGYQKKGDIYRPTIKATKETPKTFKELTKNDISKAMKEKKTRGRVKEF